MAGRVQASFLLLRMGPATVVVKTVERLGEKMKVKVKVLLLLSDHQGSTQVSRAHHGAGSARMHVRTYVRTYAGTHARVHQTPL